MYIIAWVMSMAMIAGTTIGNTISQGIVAKRTSTVYVNTISEAVNDLRENNSTHCCVLTVGGETIGFVQLGDGIAMDYVFCEVSE